MKFGSVCSGIEAASVAWQHLGWKASWFSEIEPFPSALLAHHYPNVPNLGDMTTLPDLITSGMIEAPDLLCGGTPCQAFSVAGLRKSLDDARGNLTLTFCEIANAIDSVRSEPAVIFWENVPGVLNTPDNAFGCFLGALAGEDSELKPAGKKWTNAGVVLGPKRAVAWRLLDAQYFGVAQRRRRVFVVASARKGFDPAAVLFEFEGMRRDSAPSREARESVAGGVEIGPRGGCFTEVNPTLDAGAKDGPVRNQVAGCVLHSHRMVAYGDYVNDDTASTIKARDYKDATDLVTIYENHPTDSRIKEVDLCPTDLSGWGTGGGNVPYALAENIIGRQAHNGGNGDGFTENGPMYTLNATGVHDAVHPIVLEDQGGSVMHVRQDGTVGTLRAHAHASEPSVLANMAVRRLMPIECERLQGFPDEYSNIPWRNSPDSPRYKALGNSWAVPVVAWIGSRIHDAVAQSSS